MNESLKSLTVKPEVPLELGSGDRLLNSAELAGFELFGNLKKQVSVEKFPGAIVLRQFHKGDVICRQGEAGNSGFYITHYEDAAKVVGAGLLEKTFPVETPMAAAILLENTRRVAATGGWFKKLNPFRKRPTRSETQSPEFIANDGPVDIDYKTRKGLMFAGDVFGEMSCMTLAPRSATVVAEQDCFVIEFLRSIFDQLQKDAGYREKVDAAYRERVLNGHLKRLKVFKGVDDELLDSMAQHATLHVYEPGDIICNQSSHSDSVFIVRSGVVQVVQGANTGLHPDLIDWPGLCKKLITGSHLDGVPVEKGPNQNNDPTSGGKSNKPSAADSLAAAKGGATPAGLDAKEKPSAADILAAAKGAGAKPSAADILAAAKGGARPAESDAKEKPSAADILAAAKGGAEKAMRSVSRTVAKTTPTPMGEIWNILTPQQQALVKTTASGDDSSQTRHLLADAFNEVLNRRDFLLGSAMGEICKRPEHMDLVQNYPDGMGGLKKAWSPLQVRMANYLALHAVFNEEVPPSKHHNGPMQILGYLSRGECLGEMGVIDSAPRTATCLAYDHASEGTGIRAGRVELVRIEAAAFTTILASSPLLQQRAAELIAERRAELEMDSIEFITSAWDTTPDFRDQGLVQGQNLLLIDLDTCTRCGDCVEACVSTHDDGYSRLFLDGPRFDRFLVPSACRQCFNPSCMIGCPVGSIQRGDDGQIIIEDWCIGCALCERQCPYDSIQMHDVGWLMEQSPDWEFSTASAAGKNWKNGGKGGQWKKTLSPFKWSIDFQQDLVELASEHWKPGSPDVTEAIVFRRRFSILPEDTVNAAVASMTVVSESLQPRVWLNGVEIMLSQDARQAKRGIFEASMEASELLKQKTNWLAVSVDVGEDAESSTVADQSVVLSLRLDPIHAAGVITHATTEGVALPVVEVPTERAVVCDMCHSLGSQGPACVSHCPHDAAMRVNASQFFATTFSKK
ncbi:MAG: 4Fe-4S binding protein [Planctomycetota bacterium]|nr:4Fe-4S binding protein [Planctomycetota bacterium]